ncbi:hypothetical protein Q5P01_025383 [Channa striata]|uniref:U6 snRNA-associated Sm-like protein LSm6 n=3 Tax=Percomorphaceae TaxID=1489872 RepID=A0AA88IMH1_CHASR|nr:hypothetical protein Q5P01_025383 [Channa striata]
MNKGQALNKSAIYKGNRTKHQAMQLSANARLSFGPHSASVENALLIGHFAIRAKHSRLENVGLITARMSLRKQTPSDFLKQIIGRPVVVKLNSGVDYRGVLACLDGYMNIAIEQTEEYVNGQLKNKYGDAFLRGNNVLYISTQKRKM